jgi:uncharacterized protein YggE
MKLLRLSALAAGIAVLVVFAGVGRPDRASGDTAPAQSSPSITVSGTGTVTAVPNRAVFAFGVSTKGKTAAETLSANSAATAKLIDALKAAGIASGSLQTASVSLSPVTSEQGDAIVGYTASNTISATIADLAKAGSIVDAAVGAGANEVDGPNLTVSDQASLYQSALKAAIGDARAKAQVLADASGLQLGAVASVAESGEATPVPLSARAAAPSTPIEAGTQEITATVTVVFDAS